MPLDPSIILQAKPPQIDPMAIAQNATSLQAGINQNRLIARKIASENAIGEIIKRRTNPITGVTDWGASAGDLSQNPDPAISAAVPQLAAMSLERQQNEVALGTAKIGQQSAQLDLTKKKLTAFNQGLSALLTNPNTTNNDIMAQAKQWVDRGLLSPDEAQQELQSLPMPSGDPVKDAAARKQWLQQHYLQTADATQQFEAAFGAADKTGTGGATAFGRVSPVTGYTPVGQLANTLSPGEKAAPRPTFQNGQVGTAPTSQFVDDLGNPRVAFNPTGPKLGEGSAADLTGSENAKQGVQLTRVADAVPARKAALGEMRALLPQIPQGGLGPSSDFVKKMGQFASSWGIAPPSVKEGTKAQEVFGKLAEQIAQQQFQALGGTGTDSQLGSTLKSNPSKALTDMGNEGVIALLNGNEDAVAAKNMAWQKWKDAGDPGGARYDQFSTQFNKLYDPRVFQSTYLPPADKARMLKAMSPKELAKFKDAWKFAYSQGWVTQ